MVFKVGIGLDPESLGLKLFQVRSPARTTCVAAIFGFVMFCHEGRVRNRTSDYGMQYTFDAGVSLTEDHKPQDLGHEH